MFFFLNIKFLLVLLYINTSKYNKQPSNKEKGMKTPKHQAAAAVTRCPNKVLYNQRNFEATRQSTKKRKEEEKKVRKGKYKEERARV